MRVTARGTIPGTARRGAGEAATGEAAIGATTTITIPAITARLTAIMPTDALPIPTGRAAEAHMLRVTGAADVPRDVLPLFPPILRAGGVRLPSVADGARAADVRRRIYTEAAIVVHPLR